MVTKYKWHLHIEVVVDVGVDEKVGKRFIDWHQDHFFPLFEEFLDNVERSSVDVEATDCPAHQLVKVVDERFNTSDTNAGVHFIELVTSFLKVHLHLLILLDFILCLILGFLNLLHLVPSLEASLVHDEREVLGQSFGF
jgi:hypothetical protein